MKNLVKLFGIIAFVTVIGFSVVSCDDGDSGLIDGVWDRGDIVVTFNGSSGVFSEVKSGHWVIHLNAGRIRIGDTKFRNITYKNNLTWTGQELMGTNDNSALGGWNNTIITLNGQTLEVRTEDASSPLTTYTRK